MKTAFFIFVVSLYSSFIIYVPANPANLESEYQINVEDSKRLIRMLYDIVVTGTITGCAISDSPVLTQIVNEKQLREKPLLHVGDAV